MLYADSGRLDRCQNKDDGKKNKSELVTIRLILHERSKRGS